MYTHSRARIQTEVSKSSGNKGKLNEGIELDASSIYSRMFKSVCYRRQDDVLVGPMYLTFSNIR